MGCHCLAPAEVTLALLRISWKCGENKEAWRMEGILLTPIRIGNSLYLLIPMEVAKLIGATKETQFKLTLRHSNNTFLTFEKVDQFSEETEG